ncbi:MAG: transaldolase family protein [Pseudomonadota bacterium]
MTAHVLERLAATNPQCEIWWDSSPLVYDAWKRRTLEAAPADKHDLWAEQLTRLMDPASIKTTGQMGFRGVTTNPPLSLQALEGDPVFWAGEIKATRSRLSTDDVEATYWSVYLDIVKRGAELLLPVFKTSQRRFGFLSGQVDPRLVTDGDRMLEQGLEIAAQGENVMVKIPGSKAGYEVIEELTARGIATNNTTSFTVPQYMRCMDAVSKGLKRAEANGVDLSGWRSVITHMSSRLGNIGDLSWQAEARGVGLSPEEILYGEMAVMKRAYFKAQADDHPSKMLQCSMRVIDDPSSGKASSWHIEKLAGGDFVYTCPPSYIAQLMQAEDRLPPFDPHAVEEEAPRDVMEKLLRIPYFRQAFEFDGMRPEEFEDFGAFKATEVQFAEATRRTVDFVARVLEG